MTALSFILLFIAYLYYESLLNLSTISLHNSVVSHNLSINVNYSARLAANASPTPIPEKKDPYQYVYDTFERRGYKQGKFETHDPGYEVLEWDLNRTVMWNHHNVCNNETFAFVLLFVYVTDFERRQLFREYMHQGMIVHGKKINYMMVVCVEEANEQLRRKIEEENAVYGDLMISVHKDSMFYVTITVLDAMLWIRDYCKEASYVVRMDSDCFVNFENMIDYLNAAPRQGFYGGRTNHWQAVHRSVCKNHFCTPDDYPHADYWFYYNLGGCNFYSNDLIPYINIGVLYVDLVFQTGEDYMIGEILRRAGYPPYEVKTPWTPYLWLFELNGRKWPENVIVVHDVKNLNQLRGMFLMHGKKYP